MPNYRNRFKSQEFVEHTIIDENDSVVGVIRIKPSSILWKPKSARKYYAVKIDKFSAWIRDINTKAKKTKS